MATKTVSTKAKTAVVSEEDLKTIAAIKALERAQTSLANTLSRKSVRLPSGSYALDLSVAVRGDLVVAPDVETSGSEGPTDKAGDLLAALFVGIGQDQANELMGRAMDAIKRAEQTDKGKTELAEGEAMLESTLHTYAKRRSRWRQTPAGTRAGATTGTPAVEVTGTLNGNAVSVEISGE